MTTQLRQFIPAENLALTVVLTNQCPAKCRHCGTYGGPGSRPALTLPVLTKLLEEASSKGCNFVNFTGGEPFVLGQLLVDAVAEASRRKLLVRITTNAYWATGEGAALDRLEPLAMAGVKQLYMSTSDEHSEFIPLPNLIHATTAARDLGVDPHICVTVTKKSQLNSRMLRTSFRDVGVRPPWILESPVIPFGRAADNIEDKEYLVRDLPLEPLPCASMMTHPTIQADGLMTPCAVLFASECSTLHFGNIHESTFSEIMRDIESNALVNWIHRVGVVALKQIVEENSNIVLVGRYVNICHLCYDLLSRKEVMDVLDRLEVGRYSDLGQTTVSSH